MDGKAPVVLRLDFTGMAFGGEAIARHEGKAIFVPFAMPGDSAAVELVEDRERFARGRIRHLSTPAPERIMPRCKHFGMCGGCHWQHIPYQLQLDYKTQIVREQLARIGGLTEPRVLPALGADDPWHYRNNVQFHLTRDGRLGFMAARSNTVVPIEECHIMASPVEALWRELELDLPDLTEVTLRAGIRTAAQQDSSLLHRHTDDDALGKPGRGFRPSVVEDHERLVALRLDSDEAPEAEIDLAVNCVVQLSDDTEVVLAGDAHFHETLAGHTFQISADSFFQVNTPQAEKLVALVIESARAALASIAPATSLAEPEAEAVPKSGPTATATAVGDAAPAPAPSITAIRSGDAAPAPAWRPATAPNDSTAPFSSAAAAPDDAATALPGSALDANAAILDAYCGVGTFALPLAALGPRVIAIEGAPGAVRDARVNARDFPGIEILEGAVETILPALRQTFAVAVLDPPREGCAPAVLDALSSRRVPHIVYVSCDPSTLARDVKRLAAAGYTLDSAQPIDLFPQTFHIETVARLSLRGPLSLRQFQPNVQAGRREAA